MRKNAAARSELRRVNARGSVPTFVIDGQIKVGFSPRTIRVAIAQAAQRRVGAP